MKYFMLVLLLFFFSPAFGATDFDAMTLRDDCNRNEDPLSNSGQWTNPLISTHTSRWEGTGTLCRKDVTSGTGSTYWNAATFGPNVAMAIQAVDAESTTQAYIRLFGRIQNPGDTFDGYSCLFELVAEDVIISRIDDGTFSDVQTCSTLTASIDNNDALGCEIIGSTIKGYIRRDGVWTEECSWTDEANTYPNAGNVGLQANKADMTFDFIRFDTLESEPSSAQGQALWPFIQ